MYPHRIRLGPPWEQLPSESPGRARWRRRFGYPRTLDANERTWIVWTQPMMGAALVLNGRPLGRVAAGTFEAPVDGILMLRNELVVELPVAQNWAGEVALEIRRTAYLHGVVIEPGAVSGEVIGSAGPEEEVGPFEIYVRADGQNVGYRALGPEELGRPFRIECPGLAGPGRVELVKGGSVWFVEEKP